MISQVKHNEEDLPQKKISEDTPQIQNKTIKDLSPTPLADKKIIQKNNSQILFNTVSTRSQENIKYNFINPLKEDSKTEQEKSKFFAANNLINSNTNIFKLTNYSRNENHVNYKKIDKKNIGLNKAKIELPHLYRKPSQKNMTISKNSHNSFQEFNINNQQGILSKNNQNHHSISQIIDSNILNNKAMINEKKVNKKFFINYYGGKINLIKKKNESFNVNGKTDYVPYKLISNFNG